MNDVGYTKELMMAVIVAATTLAGLGGVVMAQISASKVERGLKRWFRLALVASFVVAIVAVISAIGWLASPSWLERKAATMNFGAQLVSFSAVAIFFWVLQEKPPGKPPR